MSDEVKQAVKEALAEEKLAAEKVASDQADAFEVGLRLYMKEAKVVDEDEQKYFMATAQQLATAQSE